MATIVNNPGPNDNGSSAAGWIVAIIVIVGVILIGLFVWPGTQNTQQTGTNENTQGTGGNTIVNPPATINNTTINASTTVNNSTTTTR